MQTVTKVKCQHHKVQQKLMFIQKKKNYTCHSKSLLLYPPCGKAVGEDMSSKTQTVMYHTYQNHPHGFILIVGYNLRD